MVKVIALIICVHRLGRRHRCFPGLARFPADAVASSLWVQIYFCRKKGCFAAPRGESPDVWGVRWKVIVCQAPNCLCSGSCRSLWWGQGRCFPLLSPPPCSCRVCRMPWDNQHPLKNCPSLCKSCSSHFVARSSLTTQVISHSVWQGLGGLDFVKGGKRASRSWFVCISGCPLQCVCSRYFPKTWRSKKGGGGALGF